LVKYSQKNIALVYEVMFTNQMNGTRLRARLTLLLGETNLTADLQVVKIPLNEAISMEVDIPAVGRFYPSVVLFGM
jgi:hypothetical protein